MRGRRLKTVGIAALGVLAVMLSSWEPAMAQVRSDDPPSEQLHMKVESTNGTGCPKGTTTVIPNSDNTAFTVTYSNYTAQNGGGISASQKRAACILTVSVNVPSGYTFGITRTTFRGYADLAEGATGTLKTEFYFVGQPISGVIQRDIDGEYQDNWEAVDEIELPEIHWMPCRHANFPLNIKSELRVNAGREHPDTTSLMTMDATDSEITTLYNLAWREC